jgi:hypothetical protein
VRGGGADDRITDFVDSKGCEGDACSHQRDVVTQPIVASSRAGDDEVLAVPNDRRGRYVMPPAYRTMFLAWCVGGLPRVECRDDAEGAELLRQWGAALQLSVAKGSTLRQLANSVCLSINDVSQSPRAAGRNCWFTGRKLADSRWSGTATPAVCRIHRAATDDYPAAPLARVAMGFRTGKSRTASSLRCTSVRRWRATGRGRRADTRRARASSCPQEVKRVTSGVAPGGIADLAWWLNSGRRRCSSLTSLLRSSSRSTPAAAFCAKAVSDRSE